MRSLVARLGVWGPSAVLAALVVGCGGSHSPKTNKEFGQNVSTAFLYAMDQASGFSAGSGQWAASMGSHCTDQQTGIQLTNFILTDASSQPDGALFHCVVDFQLQSGAFSGAVYSTLYYLTVRPSGRWEADWTPLGAASTSSLDTVDACSSVGCSGEGPPINNPNHLTGDLTVGQDLVPNTNSTAAQTTTAPAPAPTGPSGGQTTSTPTTAAATPTESTPTTTAAETMGARSQYGTRCGTVVGEGKDEYHATLDIYVVKGDVSCSTAVKVYRALGSGSAPFHNTGFFVGSYYAIDGWKCLEFQMGGQGCTRGGSQILAVAPTRAS
jgi:hypothetical protein